MQTNEQSQATGEKAANQIFDDEVIREFLIESNENLNRLDSEVVDLERNPTPERLASIFRTIHTIKGTCGFLGFESLEGITHHAENILSQLRSGQKIVNGPVVSLILETIDAVRRILDNIESTGSEGGGDYSVLKSAWSMWPQIQLSDNSDTQSAMKPDRPNRPSGSAGCMPFPRHWINQSQISRLHLSFQRLQPSQTALPPSRTLPFAWM